MKNWKDWEFDGAIFLSGLLAALLQVLLDKDVKGIKEAFTRIIVGGISSIYGTKAMGIFYPTSSSEANSLYGFLFGMLGIYLLLGLIKIAKRFSNSPLKTIKDIKNFKDNDGN